MATSTQATLLRRMIRPQGDQVAENPLTSSRAVRLVLTKSANDSIGLVLNLTSVAESVGMLDDALADLSDEHLLISLMRDDALVGLAVLDQELRAAIVEMQTIGALIGQKAAARPPTHTDAFLCLALVEAFLRSFPDAVRGTSLDGWGDGARPDGRLQDLRTAGLVLADQRYRTMEMCADLGGADRQGVLQLMLPLTEAAVTAATPVTKQADWHSTFQDSVMEAPTGFEAVLHRFTVPLVTIKGLAVGDQVPLPGCTVSSVRLTAADGTLVAQAKLGQIGGMRALRLQPPPAPELIELVPVGQQPDAERFLPDPREGASTRIPEVDLPEAETPDDDVITATALEKASPTLTDEAVSQARED